MQLTGDGGGWNVQGINSKGDYDICYKKEIEEGGYNTNADICLTKIKQPKL